MTMVLTRAGQGPELQLRRRETARQPADQRAGGAGRHIQHRAGGRPDLPAQVVRRRAGRCVTTTHDADPWCSQVLGDIYGENEITPT